MSDDTIEFNNDGLKELMKALDQKLPAIKIGILKDKTEREDEQKSYKRKNSFNPERYKINNATVGAAHEFGTEHLPVRSFLRMPLSLKLNKYLEESGAFDKETLQEVLSTKSLIPWCKKVAIVAESVVIDAFDSRGFGMWPESNMDDKKVKQTLVETQQLRNSITSAVEE